MNTGQDYWIKLTTLEGSDQLSIAHLPDGVLHDRICRLFGADWCSESFGKASLRIHYGGLLRSAMIKVTEDGTGCPRYLASDPQRRQRGKFGTFLRLWWPLHTFSAGGVSTELPHFERIRQKLKIQPSFWKVKGGFQTEAGQACPAIDATSVPLRPRPSSVPFADESFGEATPLCFP